MRIAIFLGLIVLSIASAALFLNASLSDFIRDQIDVVGLGDVVHFKELRASSKNSARARGATLTDPETGRVVAHVDRVDVRLDVPWNNGPDVRLASIKGSGGRVLLRYEEGDLGVVRAIGALVDGIFALIESLQSDEPEPDQESAPYPELLFEDLELVVFSEGYPLQRYSNSTVSIFETPELGVDVVLTTGLDGGTLELHFGEAGFLGFETRGLRVSPAVNSLDPMSQDILASGFEASGFLDSLVDLVEERAYGTLREAYVVTTYVPFILGPATIPFDVDKDGVLRIEKARMGFQPAEGVDTGEEVRRDVQLSIEARQHDALILVDVDGAEFEEKFLQLIPGYEEWEGVRCSDAGSFECHMQLALNDITGEVESLVTGDGGLHIERVDIDDGGLVLEDVVGRFEVTEQQVLSFPEISARVCGGRVRVSGTLDLLTDEFRVSVSVEDIDAGQLHHWRQRETGRVDEIAGWLQGRIQGQGTLHQPETFVADGQISVRAGNFWDTPAFEQILKVLTLSQNVDAHQRVQADFTLRDKVFRVQPLDIQSDVLSLTGGGSIRFNGRMNFELRPAPVGFGMVGEVLDTLKEELLVKLEVRGTVNDARVTAIPLNIVARPFRSFWNFLFGGESSDG